MKLVMEGFWIASAIYAGVRVFAGDEIDNTIDNQKSK